ncbi:hypothetical protein FF38_01108 [Lucilia cuprina]|uniref:Uncharacterized protein n=1 Tax=Lucilia cuprina TaxID=7375 RepID=A0A0L0CGF8_LUCCU|nr:hypothetical protein CVS40_11864 [Lucilia cuprina]KNC31326.1 hypothetical protein FF38_01108 [Lucilia cuprina]
MIIYSSRTQKLKLNTTTHLICTLQREQIKNTLFGYSVGTPRLKSNDSPFKLFNLIDKRFENMMEFITTKFKESESRMKKMLDERFNELKSDIVDINERVTKLETVGTEI